MNFIVELFMNKQEIYTYSDILNSKPYNLYSNGDLIEGINLFSGLVNTNPHDSNIWVELGFAHLKNIDFKMAKLCFDTAIQINPKNSSAICALGLYHYESGNFKDAKYYYNNTLEIDKNSEWAKLNLSLLEQTSGNYSKGLSLYEEREKKRCLLLHENLKHEQIPELKDLRFLEKNKSILIIGEQGFGDQMMICLYLKKLQSLNINISYLINEKLYPFLKNIKEIDKIKIIKTISEKEMKTFDFKIFSMSLPFLFHKKKIKRSKLKISNLSLNKNFDNYPSKVKELLSQKKIFVALAWSGRNSQVRNSYRSIRLKFFNKILDNSKLNFFVMQKISNKEDLEIINNTKNFHDFSNYLNDFSDTAFLLSKMDLTISTCTSLAHLSGLLYKKTYLLLSMIHDPRWIKNNNGILYDNLKVFKQKELNNWHHPLEEINKLLRHKNNS